MLEKLRALLTNPDHWTKSSIARNAAGRSVGPNDPEATCWCMQGGIAHTTYDLGNRIWMRSRLNTAIKLRTNGRFSTVEDFNDDPHTTHDDVLALIDSAIS